MPGLKKPRYLRVLTDRFYIVEVWVAVRDVYLLKLSNRIQNHSIIRSQCQHIFSYGSDIVYFMIWIRKSANFSLSIMKSYLANLSFSAIRQIVSFIWVMNWKGKSVSSFSFMMETLYPSISIHLLQSLDKC